MKYTHKTFLRSIGLALTLDCIIPLISAAQLPNAWQITDPPDSLGGLLHYTNMLSTAEHNAATNSGFRYAVNARFLDNFSGAKTMTMAYGMGNKRFLIWFDLNAGGDLTAQLDADTTFTLTTNGTGSALYHTHEIRFDPATATASYLFDGQVKTTNWPGRAVNFAAGQIFWGAGSTPGLGQMNFHTVYFDIVGTGRVATYDAGTDTDPAVSLNPVDQGWTAVDPGSTEVQELSPDIVPLPTAPLATTLAMPHVEPYQATVSGVIDQGNLATTVWFEWGPDTGYGNATAPVQLLSDTNLFNLDQTITGLAKGATYHFRCVATNLQGIAYGEDQMFTTPEEFSVNTLADSGPGSLRQRIADALPGDTITFATNGTITLTSGELLIVKDLKIVGPGPKNLSVSGNAASRVFDIAPYTTVSISGLRIEKGKGTDGTDASAAGAAGTKGRNGGGIYNEGTLTLSTCHIANNYAGSGGNGAAGVEGTFGSKNGGTGGNGGDGGNGGGIYNYSGSLTVLACTISHNFAGRGGTGGNGGNAYNLSNGDGGDGGRGGVIGSGGGIYNHSGSVLLNSCTFAHNRTESGGDGGAGGTSGSLGGSDGTGFDDAAYLKGALGGGICNGGDRLGEAGGGLTINNSTISENIAMRNGGGIYTKHTPASATLTNTIVVGNHADSAPEIAGPYSGVNNLLGSSDPQLAYLGDYGGPTWTMPPLPNSLAIDNGIDSVTNLLGTDQRGWPRLVGEHVDIGAVEHHPSLVVITNADSGPGSLREAIRFIGVGGVITFAPNLNGQTITLTNGELSIFHDLTIRGPGAEHLTINGNGESRIFISSAGDATLDSLTLANGAADDAAGVYAQGWLLTVNECLISGNVAGRSGGGILATSGTLTLNHSTITGNSAGDHGGGLASYNGRATINLNDSTISHNSAEERGGGIYLDSKNSTFNNSTISENSAGTSGGGIYLYMGSSTFNNCTISGNSAGDSGGGIYYFFTFITAQIANTIVAGNSATTNLDIAGNFNGLNSLIGGQPQLAPLGDYGGPTQTMPPLAGSPAIDAGDDSAAVGLANDQRGYLRVAGAHVDIGGAEYQMPSGISPAPLLSPARQPDGNVWFSFNNAPNLDFTVVASTNVALPLIQWLPIGLMSPGAPGEYQFVDPQATNYPTRFYQTLAP